MKKILFALIASACFQLSAHAQSPYNVAMEILPNPVFSGLVYNYSLAFQILQMPYSEGPVYFDESKLQTSLGPGRTILIPLPSKVSSDYPLKVAIAAGHDLIRFYNPISIPFKVRVTLKVKTSPSTWDTHMSEWVTADPFSMTFLHVPLFNQSYNGFVFTENTTTVLQMGFDVVN